MFHKFSFNIYLIWKRQACATRHGVMRIVFDQTTFQTALQTTNGPSFGQKELSDPIMVKRSGIELQLHLFSQRLFQNLVFSMKAQHKAAT